MKNNIIKCKVCGRRPEKLVEAIQAHVLKITPTEYVMENEPTFDPQTGLFLCDSCFKAAERNAP